MAAALKISVNAIATDGNNRKLDNYSSAVRVLAFETPVTSGGVAVVTSVIAQLDVSTDIATAYYCRFENLDTNNTCYLYYDSGETKPLATIPAGGVALIPLSQIAVYAVADAGDTVRLSYMYYDGTPASLT